MNSFIIFLCSIVPIIIAFFIKLKNDNRERLRLEKEKRISDRNEFIKQLNIRKDQILKIQSKIKSILGQKYISYTELNSINNHIENIRIINAIPIEENPISKIYFSLITFKEESESYREYHNTEFLKKEKIQYKEYFKNLLNHPLDQQQIEVIIQDEDNCLVVAGAGCGKTTTVQGKVNYILKKELAEPHEILLLSFSRLSTGDLEKKLNHLGVECRTFHGFARNIYGKVNGPPHIVEDDVFERLIIKFHNQSLKEDELYLSNYTSFLINGLKVIKNENQFSSYKEYIEYLKDNEFESIKGMLEKKGNYKETINGKTIIKSINNEFVKSGEECYIANLLFINGIEYSYEPPYIFQQKLDDDIKTYDKNKKKYRPDFGIYLNGYNAQTIFEAENPQDNIIYLEHYGIDEFGNTPPFFSAPNKLQTANEAYLELMEWKDKVHDEFGTKLIKTFSYYFTKNSIQEELFTLLINNGVKLNPKTNTEILAILEVAYSKEIKALQKLFGTFITLFKSNGETFNSLRMKNEKSFRGMERIRNFELLNIIEIIHNQYENYLELNKSLDFNDIINHSIKIIQNKEFTHSYKYIIVDEFQDISINRKNLINALKAQSYTKLFAVGDDWQSIYRFGGSDLSLFNKFPQHFGHSIIKKIETTYRFSNPLIDVSSKFILKNPNQTTKTLNSPFEKQTKLILIDSKESSEFNLNDLKNILNIIYEEIGDGICSKSMILLGRYNSDFNKIIPDNKSNLINYKTKLKRKSSIQNGIIALEELEFNKVIPTLTVHKSKGLEADIVILINCESGRLGFPAEISDDLILSLLLSEDDTYPNGEERRAFYVAMTRAKDYFYCYGYKPKLSKFVNEIFENDESVNSGKIICPICEGEMSYKKDVKNQTGVSKFYTCNNFKYGCNNTKFIKIKNENLKI